MSNREATILKLVRKGYTAEEIAEATGVTKKHVFRTAYKYNEPIEPFMPIEDMEAAEEVLKHGGSAEDAARVVGRHPSAIYACIRHKNSTIGSWHKVIIHEMWDQGIRDTRVIAKATGLHVNRVSAYVAKHLKTDPMLSVPQIMERIKAMAPETYAALVGA